MKEWARSLAVNDTIQFPSINRRTQSAIRAVFSDRPTKKLGAEVFNREREQSSGQKLNSVQLKMWCLCLWKSQVLEFFDTTVTVQDDTTTTENLDHSPLVVFRKFQVSVLIGSTVAIQNDGTTVANRYINRVRNTPTSILEKCYI